MTINRTDAVTPDIPPLSNFRSRAEIDWVDVRIATKSPTNFNTIQTHLKRILGTEKKNWVQPLDEGPGRAATVFVIRLHDPNTFASLTELFTELEARFPFSIPPHVVAIEVAVDFYSRSNDRAELEAMTMRLKRETANSGANPRQCGPLGKAGRLKTLFLHADVEEIRGNTTLYSGTKDTDPVSWRIYLKDIDNNQQPILDVELHRARMEVTLRGDGLAPYATTLASLELTCFQGLAKKFKCLALVPYEPNAPLLTIPRLLADRKRKFLENASRSGQHELGVAKRRKFSQHSRADLALNTLIRGSLRSLTQRFSAEKRGELKPKRRNSRVTSPLALITNTTTIPPKDSPTHQPPASL